MPSVTFSSWYWFYTLPLVSVYLYRRPTNKLRVDWLETPNVEGSIENSTIDPIVHPPSAPSCSTSYLVDIFMDDREKRKWINRQVDTFHHHYGYVRTLIWKIPCCTLPYAASDCYNHTTAQGPPVPALELWKLGGPWPLFLFFSFLSL